MQSSVINHPWAHLVKPRRLHFEDLTDDQVDSTLPLDIYGHVPRDGYVSEKFARTLFPRMTSCDVMLEKLPVVELQTLRDAVIFREHSQKVMDDLLDGVYPVREYPLIKMAEMPSLLAPPTIDGRRPVLYQVVYASRENELLILEAKDFFVMLPDRLDLHCIVLNGKSINVQSHKLGFNPGLVSIKDFVWVWTVEPTDEAIGEPERILRQSRWPRLTAFDRRSVYFFRAAQFAFERLVRALAYGGIGQERFVNVWLMLGKLPTSADPLYETVVRMRLFDNLHPGSLGNTILDGVYCKRSFTPVVERPPVSEEQLRSLVLTIGRKKISLTREQQKAVLRGLAGCPVVGIPANFGSGKTLVAAVMAALSRKERVILTGDTNEVVAKVANTLCSIEEFKDRKVLRYVSLRTTWKDRDSTPVDMDQVLKNLGDDFSRDVESMADRSICRRFRERLSVSLTAQEREELELVETNVSPLLKDMAEVCERVVHGLLAKGLKTKDITIVNFYKEQQRRLEEFAQDIGVENTTVESFQNSHNEVVVLLTTKAELELPYIYGPRREKASDFLEEPQRLVTALTRARQGLIILGSEYFLSRGRNWQKIINWAIGFKGVMKSSELHKFLGDPITTRKVQGVSGSPRPRFQGLSRL
ncbi:hypothetical protein ANCCAN_26175 [Ancylostoma caninum]|uniref:DNA2/NAM7 helicase-like C-terminal domain-containing protein n=1 Tax=Ancylostoma caninum TaxID=29170 RepID=A0A368F939_ANCCA|nr:hypothetical protein ANCCAN_26175 [Ancylostoma caninum]